MRHAKLPVVAVTRMVPFDFAQGECLTHGCSVEATADICDVDPRTVERLLARAGPRAEDTLSEVEGHRQALERLERPPAVVEMDELHGRVASPPDTAGKKGGPRPTGTRVPPSPTPATPPRPPTRPAMAGVAAAVARWAATGSTRPWRATRGS
jgi:hypothetical protein